MIISNSTLLLLHNSISKKQLYDNNQSHEVVFTITKIHFVSSLDKPLYPKVYVLSDPASYQIRQFCRLIVSQILR